MCVTKLNFFFLRVITPKLFLRVIAYEIHACICIYDCRGHYLAQIFAIQIIIAGFTFTVAMWQLVTEFFCGRSNFRTDASRRRFFSSFFFWIPIVYSTNGKHNLKRRAKEFLFQVDLGEWLNYAIILSVISFQAFDS